MGLYEHWPYVNFHELNLNWMIEQMKEMESEIERVKNLADDMDEMKEKYLELIAMYNQLENDFIDFKNAVDNNFRELATDLQNEIASDLAYMMAQFDAFKNEVNYNLAGFQDQLNALDLKLDNAIENLADNFTMTNPFTGEEESITAVIYTLASFHMEDALTAAEYDNLQLTASDYDARQLTAYQYDVLGKQYLLP